MDDVRLASRIARSSRLQVQATADISPSSKDCSSNPISESSVSHHSSALADPSTSVDSLSSPSGESIHTSFDVTSDFPSSDPLSLINISGDEDLQQKIRKLC